MIAHAATNLPTPPWMHGALAIRVARGEGARVARA
jgi:hypothetical protein